jgi:hypothetical protein
MINGEAAASVFVDNRKCRARDGSGGVKSSDYSPNELSFTRAEIASECDDVASTQSPRTVSTERDRFFHAIGNERSHGSDEGRVKRDV